MLKTYFSANKRLLVIFKYLKIYFHYNMFKNERTYGEGIRRSLAAPVWRSLSGVKSQIFFSVLWGFCEKIFYVNYNMYSLWKCFLSEDSKEGREAAEWPVGLSAKLGVSATSTTIRGRSRAQERPIHPR